MSEKVGGKRQLEKRGNGNGFEGIDGLVKEVAEEAFELGGENVEAVRVIVEAHKLVLLAENFKVDVTIPSGRGEDTRPAVKAVTVEELTIPVIIGVNPPEREAKQRVVTDSVFYEKAGAGISHVEYQRAVDKLAKEIESSSYLPRNLWEAADAAHGRCRGILADRVKLSELGGGKGISGQAQSNWSGVTTSGKSRRTEGSSVAAE
ncbi:hypothetical protein EST38_g9058 [Candolleomyces aberdarensis]|uniref:Uncharacterized protein n=1 Tax=Candolleomyces aberdarensis TaxID=2316362 RepID=A0A4Q2DB27_9AGAR|nr:hypothetical protein EST38_g9058 [Candolleomyces aberdarensis]